MAKKMVILSILIFAFTLFGCAKTPPSTEYQTKDFQTDATIEINQKSYSVHIQKKAEAITMTFTSPDSIKGVTIEKNAEGTFFSSGNVKVPISANTNITAESLKLFELDETDIISRSADMIGGVKVQKSEFDTPFGKAMLYISSENSIPLIIEATINGTPVKYTFSSFVTEE